MLNGHRKAFSVVYAQSFMLPGLMVVQSDASIPCRYNNFFHNCLTRSFSQKHELPFSYKLSRHMSIKMSVEDRDLNSAGMERIVPWLLWQVFIEFLYIFFFQRSYFQNALFHALPSVLSCKFSSFFSFWFATICYTFSFIILTVTIFSSIICLFLILSFSYFLPFPFPF